MKWQNPLLLQRHLEHITDTIRKALHHRSGFNLEYQIKLSKNETKWVRVAGKAYYDQDGKPLYIAGAILDITEHKQDEIRKMILSEWLVMNLKPHLHL